MGKIAEAKRKSKNGQEVIFRSPTLADAAETVQVMKSILAQSEYTLTTAEEFTSTVEEQVKMFSQYEEHPDKLIILTLVKNKIVGFMNFRCGIRKRNAHQGDFGMSLLPEFRGVGIGKMMLEELIQWARQNPRVETVRLEVHSQNNVALKMYRDLGFIEEGRQVRAVRKAPGVYDDVIAMALDVR